MSQTGLVQLDLGYQRETVYFPYVPTSGKFVEFLDIYKRFSNAGIRKYAVVTSTYMNESGELVNSQDVDEVLMICLEYYDDDNCRRSFTFPIPAPNREVLEFVEGQGYRLPKEQGDALAEAYSTLTGGEYTFRRGYLLA